MSDAVYISVRMREQDVKEVNALGKDPLGSLVDGLIMTDECLTVFVDREPAMMFGACPESVISGSAVVWALGTDKMFERKFSMVREGRKIVKLWLEKFNKLHNIVDARNHLSIRWLEMIGFTIDRQGPLVINGHEFYRFEVKNV